MANATTKRTPRLAYQLLLKFGESNTVCQPVLGQRINASVTKTRNGQFVWTVERQRSADCTNGLCTFREEAVVQAIMAIMEFMLNAHEEA